MAKRLWFLVLIPSLLQALSNQDVEKIGKQIFLNEASGKDELLIFWSPHEAFPSLGIGHNLWFPQGVDHEYKDEFPLLCGYLEVHGVTLPAWLKVARDNGVYYVPWQSREEFIAELSQKSERMMSLRQMLKGTIALQTQYMMERLNRELYVILSRIEDHEQRDRVARYIVWMKKSAAGHYALIDYSNFKGSGLDKHGIVRLLGAGLFKVLCDMQDETVTEQNVVKMFTTSAGIMLWEIIRTSKGEYLRYALGWTNRILTYSEFR